MPYPRILLGCTTVFACVIGYLNSPHAGVLFVASVAGLLLVEAVDALRARANLRQWLERHADRLQKLESNQEKLVQAGLGVEQKLNALQQAETNRALTMGQRFAGR